MTGSFSRAMSEKKKPSGTTCEPWVPCTSGIPKCLDDSQTQPVSGSIPNLAHFNRESTWKISPSNGDLICVTSNIDILSI